MSMDITQELMDRAALVVVIDEDGLYQWSSTRSKRDVAAHLHKVADAIAAEPS